RPRAKRGAEAKIKESAYDDDEDSDGDADEDEDLDDIAGDDEEIDLHIAIPKIELDSEIAEEVDSAGDDLDGEDETEDEEDESEPAPSIGKRGSRTPASPKPGKEPKSAI